MLQNIVVTVNLTIYLQNAEGGAGIGLHDPGFGFILEGARLNE
jgi:hypothetical protein